MRWLWSCFGGKKERSRRKDAGARSCRRTAENSRAHASPTNLQSLGAHVKSPPEVSAYDEPLQSKQAIPSTSHGSKLFKRKSVRRAKSCGSSTAFENGAKRLFDKHTGGHINRLQEEVEGLKRRLAQEEEEAQKLRHEVSYLRSCGVLQSPDRQRKEGSIEKDLFLRRDEKCQPNSPSWLGLTLSPTSRFKLEEQLRILAADEMSKVPSRGLTNGQKAIIVATKIWRKQGHPQEERQSMEFARTGVSDGHASHCDISVVNQLNAENDANNRRFDPQSPLTNQDPSFREQLQFAKFSNISESSEYGSPGSTVTELDNFSFHPSTGGDKVDARQFGAEKLSMKGKPQLQRRISCPEPMMTCFSSLNDQTEPEDEMSFGSATENVECEYGKQGTQPASSPASQNADSDHVQARRFIDLRYQELEEKLLKSPKSEPVLYRQNAENSIPDEEGSSAEPDASDASEDTDRSEVQDIGYSGSPSSLGGKTYFAGKSGRMWRPLSPVRESDSGRSSREDLAISSASHFRVSDSADSSSASDLKSSLRTIISASKWEQKEVSSHHGNSDSHDDDLFTLSPRRLHHGYDSWYNSHRSDDENESEQNMNSERNPGTGGSSASGDEGESEDIAPIQCQSPAFSPRQILKKNKVVDGKALKVEDYQRDKYFKEMGFEVDEFLFRSGDSIESGGSEKYHQDGLRNLVASGVIEDYGRSTATESVVPEQLGLGGSMCQKGLGASDCEDCDHPVLSSIENLPKLIEGQSACNISATLKDTQHERNQMIELERQRTTVDGCQQSKSVASASEFSLMKDMHDNPLSQSCTESDDRLRMSLHGFVYEEDEQDLECPILEEHSAFTRRFQNSTVVTQGEQTETAMMRSEPEISPPCSKVMCHQIEIPTGSKNAERARGQFRESPNHQSSDSAHQRVERVVRLDNDLRNDLLSHAQSLGYTIRIPKFKDSFSDAEFAFESSSVGGDSEPSKDGDETFHDCESPALSEASSDPGQSGSSHSEPNHQYFRNSKIPIMRDDAVSGKKTSDISPDDRPILGTVATHWGDTSNPKPQREWDGLGIPNSTSKFKEDQRVSWHTTPFETRLEQALAKLPIVPELHNQRRLFEEVAMS